MIAAAPYDLHWLPLASSFSGSHVLATRRPSALTGTPGKSPFSGVTMRYRQSSVTTATQEPFRSNGAFSLGVAVSGGGAANWAPTRDGAANESTARKTRTDKARSLGPPEFTLPKFIRCPPDRLFLPDLDPSIRRRESLT